MKKQLLTIGIIIITLIVSTTLFAGWNGIKGDGNVVKKEFNVETIDGINLGSIFKIHLKQGSTQSVVLEMDQNIMDIADVRVSRGVLSVDFKESIRQVTEMNAYITVKDLNSLNVSGASHLTFETDIITKGKFKFDVSGAANVKKGSTKLKADAIDVNISGAGKIGNLEISCNTLKIDASGAGNLTFSGTADKKIIDASGAANVSVEMVKSKESEVEVSGAGNVVTSKDEKVAINKSGAGSVRTK